MSVVDEPPFARALRFRRGQQNRVPTGATFPLAEPTRPRTFDLFRHSDPSGISGTGVIAQGTQFRDGQIALQWRVRDMPRVLQIWDSIDDVIRVHGHNGQTEVRFHDAA